MNRTEAWVLYNLSGNQDRPRGLELATIDLGEVGDDEVLVEPLYGCWEGNMGHALARQPIDVAAFRGEDRIVIGNSGVVRVLATGAAASDLQEGDICVLTCAVWDKHGMIERAVAYDAAGTTGILAKRSKFRRDQLVKVPEQATFSLPQWAAFTARYITAWGNWNIAHQCWRALRSPYEERSPAVWGWGGGTAFAEVTLAAHYGFETALISSDPQRLAMIADAGVTAIDRREFRRVDNEEGQAKFLACVQSRTRGQGVSIFVDHIGAAVTEATLNALARPGVITTSGWKTGMRLATDRSVSAAQWHTFVHTHYARRQDCVPAINFAVNHNWMAPEPSHVYRWEEVPSLAAAYADGGLTSYFPTFQVNA